jgi:hypothetical protein
MAEKEKKEKVEKKRRIQGDAFWKLKSFEKRIKDLQEELTEWELSEAEELDLYPDQINWMNGAIYKDGAEIRDGRVINAETIARLPHDVLSEHKKIIDKSKQIDKDMTEFQNNLSRQMNIWPDMIDLKTGIIADNNYDGFDPDTEDEVTCEEIEEETKE